MPASSTEPRFWDVALVAEWLDGGQRPGCCELRIRMVPEVRAYLDLNPEAIAVHRFRYVRADGHDACLLTCGECGHLVHCAEDECGPIATEPCRRCGALQTGSACPRWHNWGRCLQCDEGPVFAAAGIALAAVGPVDRFDLADACRHWSHPAKGRLAGDPRGADTMPAGGGR